MKGRKPHKRLSLFRQRKNVQNFTAQMINDENLMGILNYGMESSQTLGSPEINGLYSALKLDYLS
jgi:hypothetical protein